MPNYRVVTDGRFKVVALFDTSLLVAVWGMVGFVGAGAWVGGDFVCTSLLGCAFGAAGKEGREEERDCRGNWEDVVDWDLEMVCTGALTAVAGYASLGEG